MGIKNGFNLFLLVFVLQQHLISKVYGACTWPAEFESTQWHDSSRGIITFGTDSMQGWTLKPNTDTTVTSWDCVSISTYNTDGRMILITSQPFQLFTTNYYAYLCITVTKVTDSSYRYHINHEIDSNINYERIFIYPVGTLTDQGTICSDNGASVGEYQMLIKEGSEADAKIDCPWHFLGRYGYTHTAAGGTSTCDQATSEISMCTDTQEMTFNYAECSTKVAYSVSDTVWCVDNIAEGETNYVMVFNGIDSASEINNQDVYRFTCMAVSGDLTSASVAPKYCQDGQTPDEIPTTSAGLQTGARLAFSSAKATCPVLTDPPQGNVSISTTGSVTSALYTCAENYTLWGIPSRTCQADSTWTGEMPYCSCGTPLAPSNGMVEVNSNGSVATYTCDVGFTLSGLESRNCQSADATWEGTDPTCTQCEALSTITGQTSTKSTNGTSTSVSFVCAAGYSLSGSSSLSCSADGTWNSQQPDCVDCDTLTNPASGSVTLSTDGITTTASYTCASGYTLQGDTTRTCNLSGRWDGSNPICYCNQPTSPSNGAVVADGAQASYTCNVGFTLSGEVTRTCQSDGTGWSDSDPQCTQCNALSSVTGGSYTLSTTGTITSAKYSCEVGFSLDGVTTINCQSDGLWSSSSPTCVVCPTLTDPTSGTVTLSTSGTKTSATYACASGYDLNGNTIRLCNSDGTWSLMEPTCTCKSPVAPLNGLVLNDGDTATYTCDQGYSLSGLSIRTCATDGTGWSGADPACNTCATLSTLTGGTVDMTTDGINTQAAFTCNNGYTLNGVTPITCRSDGTWDFTTPTCVKCPDLTDPDSGTVTITTTGSVTTATFSCMTGYYLSGAFTLTCASDGSWNNNAPTCKCIFPAQPSNGEVSVSGTGTVATYSCDTGYSLNGLSSRTCQTDGTGWEGSDPSCNICQTITNPTSGSFSLSSNGTHTSVIYTCEVGATLSGDANQVCQADGSWESASPTCVGCPTLAAPGSGSVIFSTSSSSTTATFSCVVGYTLNSTGILSCTSAGTWDLPAPSCVCLSPSSVANGNVTLSADLRTVTYTCNVGYVLVGSEARTCQDDGTGWNGVSPVCDLPDAGTAASTEGQCRIPIDAMVIVILIIVVLLVLLGVFIGMYCRSRQQNSSRVSSASSRGPEDPEVLCPSLTPPNSGAVTLSTSGTQTVAAYSCGAGYILNGNAERTCNPDGTWSDTEPTCTCDTPASPLNGLVTADGENAVYSCNQGYSMDGLSTRTCGTDGSAWSGSAPTCSTCGTLSTPSGGVVDLSTDGINTRAKYTCNTGYTLNGVILITCRNDGTWDFTEPSCAKCADLSDPDSGTVTLTTTGSVTTATFTCQSGYYLRGEFSLTCDTDGAWSNNAPTCHCNFPVQPDNGQISLSGTGTVATYRCDTGYTLNGLSARTCQTDGTGWEGPEPRCTLCQTISAPSSGSFSLITNGTQTTVNYACAVGTSLDGENEILCVADGSWVSSPPTCVQCGDLSDPDSGFVSLTTNGLYTVATFSCVTGYTLNSTGILTCMSTGAWDLSSPYCICQPPPLISNGEFNISSDLRTVTYTCNVGYVLVGSETRTCQNDGTGWDGISPVCDTVGSDNGSPTNGSAWKIPIAAVLTFLLLFVGLGILLVTLTYLYCKVRKKKSKIETMMPEKAEERIVEAESPEELPEPKPTGEKATLLKKYHSKESRPGSSLTTSSVIFANGLSVPVKAAPGKVQLPPISHVITEKRGKRKTERLKKTTRAKVRQGGEGAVAKKDQEEEVDISRAKTPDLLHALEFNYIQPVYSYEIDTQAETGRESVASRRKGNMKIAEKKKKSGL